MTICVHNGQAFGEVPISDTWRLRKAGFEQLGLGSCARFPRASFKSDMS